MGIAVTAASGSNSNSLDSQRVNQKQAVLMTGQEALEKFGLSACANRVNAGAANTYWIDGELVKLV